jgi:uncharacterized protein YyaL (SSP411 family)
MDDPTDRNRLDAEASPYLRQHADNPVHWQPWDDAALDAARKRDDPIFLSVGYAACHWCHVMEAESFRDETVADLLNRRFVPIKVDREERPDVDRVYQTICQRVTGRGGWPLSVFLTPDREPFYVGTYFPRDPRRGTPGFEALLRDVADSWADPEERDEIESRASDWTDAVRRVFGSSAGDTTGHGGPTTPNQNGLAGETDRQPSGEALVAAADVGTPGADREHGGWGGGQKFPHPGRVRLLLRAADRGGDVDDYRTVAREALDAMADRGLHDHLGGGFHRYTTDREWTVPHFEKMLYDNAELARLYVEAGRAFGGADPPASNDEPAPGSRYRAVADATLDFLDRELGHSAGGFRASLDAESAVPGASGAGVDAEREEGAFYVWTPGQVRAALDDPELADLFCDRYGVTTGGNVEGANTLRIDRSIAALASEHDLDPASVRQRLDTARERLVAARGERPRPPVDDKVIAGWNGLAVSAFAAAGVADAGRRSRARDCLAFVRDRLWNGDRLVRRWAGGDVKGDGVLADYAFVGRGAFDLYGVTGDIEPLGFAIEVVESMVDAFYDPDAGTLHYATGDDLIARPAEVADGSTPSSLGVATNLLLSVDAFVDDDFAGIADTVLGTHADRVRASPLEHVSLVTAADRLDRGDLELTLAADPIPDAWRSTLDAAYRPRALLAPRPPEDADGDAWRDRMGIETVPPIWAGRAARDGPTAYACVDHTCSPPMDDLDAALRWAAGNGP